MATESGLEEELRILERRWGQLDALPESLRPLMSIIEYYLGSHQKAEVYVNRLLRYFLDSDEPHGMRTEFLRAFLEGLPAECGFEEDTYDLSDIRVAEAGAGPRRRHHRKRRDRRIHRAGRSRNRGAERVVPAD